MAAPVATTQRQRQQNRHAWCAITSEPIDQRAAEHGRHGSERRHAERDRKADLPYIHAVQTNHERGQPGKQAGGDHVGKRTGGQHVQGSAVARQHSQEVAERRGALAAQQRRAGLLGGVAAGAARGLANRLRQHQHQQQTREPHEQESRAPPVCGSNAAREREADHGADVRSHVVDAERARAALGWKVVGQDGHVGRGTARFGSSHADARQQQPPETGRQRAQSRKPAPDGEQQCQQPHAMHAIDEHAQRHAGQRERNRVGDACQQAALRVRKVKFPADRLQQQRDRHAIQMKDHVDAQQDREHITRVRRPRGDGRSWSCAHESRSRIDADRCAVIVSALPRDDPLGRYGGAEPPRILRGPCPTVAHRGERQNILRHATR